MTYITDTSQVSSIWSAHGHHFISTDDENYESCIVCGGMWQFLAHEDDPTRGVYLTACGNEPDNCTGDTSMSHGYSGERDEGTPDYPLNVDHNCNCIRCDS